MHLLMVGTTAPSHVYPGLAVIAELVRRGHHVTYAVGEAVAPLVTPTGAEVLAHPSILPTADEDWPQDVALARHLFLDAETLERIGAGVRLGAVDADGLRSAVAAARGCAARARELREEVRRTGGHVAAADAVERLAAG